MRIINLSSGSDGNLTYIESSSQKILLDDGLSCTETIKRLNVIGISPSDLNAIIVTHEHSDHIKGIDLLSSKANLPVYAHSDVWVSLDDKLKRVAIKNRRLFDDDFSLGELEIHPIELPHDVKCFGYSFIEGNKKISVLTDLGHLTERILKSASGSQIIYVEANYDKDMLYNGTKYPLALKRRIDGPNGHLSNIDSGNAVEFFSATGTRQIVLSHLSKENNSPQLAYTFITEQIKKKGVIEGEDIHIDVATPNIGSFFRLR